MLPFSLLFYFNLSGFLPQLTPIPNFHELKSQNLKSFFISPCFTPVIFIQLTLSQNCPPYPVSTLSVEIQIFAISCLDSGKCVFFSCICAGCLCSIHTSCSHPFSFITYRHPFLDFSPLDSFFHIVRIGVTLSSACCLWLVFKTTLLMQQCSMSQYRYDFELFNKL